MSISVEYEPLIRSLIWKRRIGYIASFLPRVKPQRRVVLIYHSVGGGMLSLSLGQFKEQLEWLGTYSQVVSIDELFNVEPSDKGLRVALTFDDGYRTLFSNVAPLLAERNWSATVYLNTDHIGEEGRQFSQPQLGHYPEEEFLKWGEVEQLSKQGWIIGSHGCEHLDLTKTDAVETLRQLEVSKKEIEIRLGQQCRHFAYTWGNCNHSLRQKVKDAGYTYAAAAIHGSFSADIDILSFPRIDVRKEYALSDFASAVSGDWDYLDVIQRFRRLIR